MKKYLIVLIGIFLISFISAVPYPHAFYGNVNYSDGNFVETGTITAMIDEAIVGSSNIINGAYDLTIESEYGGLIYFYFNEEPFTSRIFNVFEITELNLVLSIPKPVDEPEEPFIEEDDDESHTHTSSSSRPKQYCEPNWRCGGWSSCESGRMTRECYDANHCRYSYNMPNEVAGCEITEKVFVGKESNSPNVLYLMGILTIVVLLISLVVLIKK